MAGRHEIIFAESEKQIIETMGMYLESVGCPAMFVENGERVLDLLKDKDRAGQYMAVVLDTRISSIDMNRMIHRIRTVSLIPIIILAPESEMEDRILALNLGADAYITEPVHPMEFAVMIRTIVRRYAGGTAELLPAEVRTETPDRLTVGDLVLDTKTLSLSKKGREIGLTPIEYKILYRLMKTPGEVCSKKELCRLMNEQTGGGYENAIMVHISHLRAKVEEVPHKPQYIRNVRGIGYKIEKK